MQQLEIKLEPNGVATPAQRAAWQCSEIVTSGL
jgi:predicted flap endonuclease-1-like 5' DNA nuclease